MSRLDEFGGTRPSLTGSGERPRHAMKVEPYLFLGGILFFIPIGLIYAWWSDGEPVGTVGIPLVGGLVGMIGGYLLLLSRRIDARPELRVRRVMR